MITQIYHTDIYLSWQEPLRRVRRDGKLGATGKLPDTVGS